MRSASSAGKMNILLCGYYGFHNAGDDATLHAVMDSIRSAAPQAELTVLSGSPEETACLYRCRAAARFSLPAVCRALRACDALVFGGGSLLQDVTSTRSLLYYLLLLRAARLLGKKTMLFGNGIGPVLTAANRRRVAAAVRKIDCVTLRDEDSLHELEKMVDAEMAVAFAMYPTGLDDLMSIADTGAVMPPKSTWFEPKLRSGLFIHKLS